MQLSPAHTRSYASYLPSHLTSLTRPGGCHKFPSQLSLNVLCCVLACGGSAGQCSIARCGNILTWRQCSSYHQVEEAHITHQQAETPQLPPAPLLRPALPHSAALFVRLRWSRRGAARSRSPGLLNKTSFIIIQSEVRRRI